MLSVKSANRGSNWQSVFDVFEGIGSAHSTLPSA